MLFDFFSFLLFLVAFSGEMAMEKSGASAQALVVQEFDAKFV